MFETGHDAANRAVFRAEPADMPDIVGPALHGPKKEIDKATKGRACIPKTWLSVCEGRTSLWAAIARGCGAKL
jgi:hypothetical protein